MKMYKRQVIMSIDIPTSLQILDDQTETTTRGTRQSVGTREVMWMGRDPCGRPRPCPHRSPFSYDEWRREACVAGGTPTGVPTPPHHLPRPYKGRFVS